MQQVTLSRHSIVRRDIEVQPRSTLTAQQVPSDDSAPSGDTKGEQMDTAQFATGLHSLPLNGHGWLAARFALEGELARGIELTLHDSSRSWRS